MACFYDNNIGRRGQEVSGSLFLQALNLNRALERFANTHSEVSAIYYVTGERKDGSVCCLLVEDSQLVG